jgi:hypothetical protein
MPALLNLVTGWLLFSTLALAMGVVVTRWIILAPTAKALPARERRVFVAVVGRRVMWGLLLAMDLVFARQIVEFHDPYSPWSEDLRILLGGTAWGTTWMLAVVATILA